MIGQALEPGNLQTSSAQGLRQGPARDMVQGFYCWLLGREESLGQGSLSQAGQRRQ